MLPFSKISAIYLLSPVLYNDRNVDQNYTHNCRILYWTNDQDPTCAFQPWQCLCPLYIGEIKLQILCSSMKVSNGSNYRKCVLYKLHTGLDTEIINSWSWPPNILHEIYFFSKSEKLKFFLIRSLAQLKPLNLQQDMTINPSKRQLGEQVNISIGPHPDFLLSALKQVRLFSLF